jgi:hypothetical protein
MVNLFFHFLFAHLSAVQDFGRLEKRNKKEQPDRHRSGGGQPAFAIKNASDGQAWT